MIIDWTSNKSKNKKEISINEYIEKNDDEIKNNLNKIFFKLSNFNKLKDKTTFFKNYNLSDTSIIQEKSIYKLKNFNEIIKIIALILILKRHKKIYLKNINSSSLQATDFLCTSYKKKIIFEKNSFLFLKKKNLELKTLLKIIFIQLKTIPHLIRIVLKKLILPKKKIDYEKENFFIGSNYRYIGKNINNSYKLKNV